MSMVYVKDLPWSGVGAKFDKTPTTSKEIIDGGKIGFRSASTPMYTQHHTHEDIGNYHVMYREDTNEPIGVINQQKIKITQNENMFRAVESLIGIDLVPTSAAMVGRGSKVFGFFKTNEGYKVEGDDIDHYVVIMNDHLKPDGKITVLNYPVRLVCTNGLTEIVGRISKYRVSCSDNMVENQSIAAFIRDRVLNTQIVLERNAENKLKQKLTKEHVEKILDDLFPYLKADVGSSHDRANETTSMIRETFLTKCMNADDLQNFKGTFYQLENALLDFSQHYFMSNEKGIDLERRLAEMPGLVSNYQMSKYFKLQRQLVA